MPLFSVGGSGPVRTNSTGGELMSAISSLRKLEYLLAVARELHVTRAAERLHVDKSHISRGVRDLEQEFDFTVFIRGHHRVVAIEQEAVPFILDVEQALARFDSELERAIKLARLRARRKASSFVVGYSPFVVPTVPGEIRSVHSRSFPSIHLEMRRSSAQDLTDSLISDACQACVMFRPAGTRYFEEILLGSERLFAVWPRSYRAASGGRIAFGELRGHPLILPCSEHTDPVLHRWFLNQCAAAGFRLKLAAEASSPPDAFNLVEDGVGIAILPGGFSGDVPRALQSSEIDGLEPLQLIITYRSEASVRVQKMSAEIARELARTGVAKTGSRSV